MRKLILIASLAMAATLALGACSKPEAAPQQTQQAQEATKPTDPADRTAWKQYLVQVLKNNMQGMTADRPYPYLVPAGDSEESVAERERQLENVRGTVARGVLPGNLLAFGGASSATTADFITQAFADARPGSFKGVIVLFIGDQADQQRVADALATSDATFRFVEM